MRHVLNIISPLFLFSCVLKYIVGTVNSRCITPRPLANITAPLPLMQFQARLSDLSPVFSDRDSPRFCPEDRDKNNAITTKSEAD